MRTDPTDLSIHDLTDDEATALREVCERIFRGPVEITQPLFVQWAEACGLDDRQRLFVMVASFLPRALHALLLRADSEREEARSWVRRLTNTDRVLTCAFCGVAYPPGTSNSNSDALTDHIRTCPKHPMREAESEIAKLHAEIARMQRRARDLQD